MHNMPNQQLLERITQILQRLIHQHFNDPSLNIFDEFHHIMSNSL